MAASRSTACCIGLCCLGLIYASCVFTSCAQVEKTPEVFHAPTPLIPSKLAVLPATFSTVKKKVAGEFPVDGQSEKGKFIGELARGVIHNQLAGKGYDMRLLSLVDQKHSCPGGQNMSAQDLCNKLGVDGLVYPEVVTATMVTGVAYNLFKIEAKFRLVDKTGTELGIWQDSASKRKIALPTSPVGIATTIAGALLDDSAKKQMRLVIYDWGWKVCRLVPESLLGKSLPAVVSVDSNIDKGVFATGGRILVEVEAEKNLSCTFDIGEFKRNLPMADAGNGIYKGEYVVQEGDQVSNQPLSIHLFRSNGVERVWLETGAEATIDGIPPPVPEKVEVQASRSGVSLKWTLPQGEDLQAFAVEKSEKAVGEFVLLAGTKALHYLDADVSQGSTYYYRIRSVDLAGNRSTHARTVQVTMPFFDEVTLTGALSGILVSGVYRVEGESRVARGEVLDIGAGSKVTLGPEARIVVNGVLKVRAKPRRPTIFEGRGWKGIFIGKRGEAELAYANMRGCSPCMEADDGNAVMQAVTIKGDRGDGILVNEDGVVEFINGLVTGCRRGIAIEGGKGIIEESTLTDNGIGLDIVDGDITLTNSNIFDNSQTNLRARRKLVTEGNYLGGTTVKDLKLEGDVLVKSLLDAPFPQGRNIVLVDDREITPEALERQFASHKESGIQAFKERRFGDAYQELSKALKIRDDKEAYLYLAYAQSILGEEEKMSRTLEQGIKAFPYEVKFYQPYVKYLATHGEKEKALSLLEKAVKMNPEDRTLLFMKQYVETMGN